MFLIGKSNGAITLAKALDYEQFHSHTLYVMAEDDRKRRGTKEILKSKLVEIDKRLSKARQQSQKVL